jgi:hypothetical protein
MEPRSVPGRGFNRFGGDSSDRTWPLSGSPVAAITFSPGGAFLQSRAKAVTSWMARATVERVAWR